MNIEFIEKHAKKIVESGQQHVPMIFMKKDDELIIKSMPYENRTEKEIILKFLRDFVQRHKVEKYWTVFEAWVGENPDIMPSRDWNREEALVISEFSSDLKKKTLMLKFKRNLSTKEVKWTDRQFMEGENLESRWDFYREDIVEEKFKKLREEKHGKKDKKDN